MDSFDWFVIIITCTNCGLALYLASKEFCLWVEKEFLDWRISVNNRKIWAILNS